MIELKTLTKKFDAFTVLDGIDLTIPKGSAFGLLGSNGAGKSTILRLVSGVYSPESGNVTVDGEDVYNNVAAKRKVFFINDETVQFTGFTLSELKNYYKNYYPNFSEELFQSMRARINLPENKKISTFSKGMKRQAIVITAIACCPDYLLLDEAFDGLDPTMRIIVKRILVDAMVDRQLTVVISSHNLKEMNELCDTVALLHKGKIVFSKDLSSVKGSVHKIQVAFEPVNPSQPQGYTAEEFRALGIDILHFSRAQSVYHIIARGDIEDIKHRIQVKNPVLTDSIPLTLEEVFIYEMEVLGYDFAGTQNNSYFAGAQNNSYTAYNNTGGFGGMNNPYGQGQNMPNMGNPYNPGMGNPNNFGGSPYNQDLTGFNQDMNMNNSGNGNSEQ